MSRRRARLVWLAELCLPALSMVTLLAACGRGSSSADDNYGVAPWTGPTVVFQGSWGSTDIKDESGAVVPNGSASIQVIVDGPNGKPDDVSVQVDGDNACLRLMNGTTPTTTAMTADGHGFDGTAGSQNVAVHARVDASGVMHVELDTSGTAEISPTNTIVGTCAENFSFDATKNK